MGFRWIVIMHKGQQATTATEGRERTKGRTSLEQQQMAAVARGGLTATVAKPPAVTIRHSLTIIINCVAVL